MTSTIDPVTLTEALIAAESVTPARGAVFDVLEAALVPAGFQLWRSLDGTPPAGPVENLLAVRAGPDGGRHFAFAGHLDVVPAGEGWTGGAFTPERRGGLLYGRGAVDMKGAVAAFVAAAEAIPVDAGTLSLVITGDEEGPALHGTRALMTHMAARQIRPDFILVGEPTSVDRLGDMVKIGRRGSVNIWVRVPGTQGHVAYPHLADNPLPRLVRILTAIDAIRLDDGNDWFQPSNIEITDIAVGNDAHNMIPGAATARLSIRFNDRHRGEALIDRIRSTVLAIDPAACVDGVVSGEAFLTEPGAFSALVTDAVESVTGITPVLSTSGGTSDARFLRAVAPVIECGLVNATMHKVDEAVAVDDLIMLTEIYRKIALAALSSTPDTAGTQ